LKARGLLLSGDGSLLLPSERRGPLVPGGALMERTVSVCKAERSVEAFLEWDERPPWRVALRVPGLEPAEASGNDLFECLLAVREQLGRAGWKVCVVGGPLTRESAI
jgi:hypothetical protein